MAIKKLGVLGIGQMGTGIVQVFAQAGYDVVAVGTRTETLEKSLKGIEKRGDGSQVACTNRSWDWPWRRLHWLM